MEFKKFRKTPEVIEAIQFDYETFVYNRHDAYPMVDGDLRDEGNPNTMTAQNPVINTLVGKVGLEDGDWIVKGSRGKYFSVPNDEFVKAFESVE